MRVYVHSTDKKIIKELLSRGYILKENIALENARFESRGGKERCLTILQKKTNEN